MLIAAGFVPMASHSERASVLLARSVPSIARTEATRACVVEAREARHRERGEDAEDDDDDDQLDEREAALRRLGHIQLRTQ